MRRFVLLFLVAGLMAGCGDGNGDGVEETTTNPAPALTTTTTTTTTTLSPSTTTTIPKASIKAEIGVYDGWIRTVGGFMDFCLTREEFKGVEFSSWVGKDRNVQLKDASTNEVLAVALLGPGSVEVDEEGYEFCMFRGTFHQVPLDRSVYVYAVEGDHWGDDLTVDASELEGGTVGMVYYESSEQKKREEAHND